MSIEYGLDIEHGYVRYVYNLKTNSHYYRISSIDNFTKESRQYSPAHKKSNNLIKRNIIYIKQTKLTQLIYNIPDLDWDWKINV